MTKSIRMYSEFISFIRATFQCKNGFVPLHAPHFGGNEKKYVLDTIDSTFVSSVGAYVNRFEEMMAELTGARYAVATTNGTSALHLALIVAGVERGEEVITQPLSFIATANAISYCGGEPVFIDVDKDTMGMSPDALEHFLAEHVTIKEGKTYNKTTGKRIAGCVPMHTFGLPCRIEKIAEICGNYGIPLVEDAAEAIGSYYKSKHAGTYGMMGVFSFNGNKTITCGGGGAIVTNDERIAKRLKHLSTTAKLPSAWEFVHDEIGYNYRMPNLNAALACAQLEQLPEIVKGKRELASIYRDYLCNSDIQFVKEAEHAEANYWLNTIILPSIGERDKFLEETNRSEVMTRPTWRLLNKLPMYEKCLCGPLDNATWLEERAVNIPSSYRTVLIARKTPGTLIQT
jgi:perosamine synthetase